MSEFPRNGGSQLLRFVRLRLPNFDISWAGPNPVEAGFCFGSEDGKIVHVNEEGQPLTMEARVSPSHGAINGVAGSGDWIAASTRHEVAMGNWLPKGRRVKPDVAFPYGAHGVTAAGAYFVAPLGVHGILIMQAGSAPNDPVEVLTSDDQGLYFYRVIALPGTNGKHFLVSACRDGGVGIAEMRLGESWCSMSVARFDGLDIVDICPMAFDGAPAMAALGLDGTIIMLRDAFNGGKAVHLKFGTVQGTAYRLLSRGQDLYVLTSRGLFGLMKLGHQMLSTSSKVNTNILTVRMEAVDANMVGDRWLLVVMPDEVWRFDLSGITKPDSDGAPAESMSEQTLETWTPAWTSYEVRQTEKQLTAIS
jgi:hypothetical protein